ncbi:hypothetical protein ACRAWD_21880 [Caulobacter segnis]
MFAAVTLDSATAAARKAIRPEELIWVVVGDRAVIEPKPQGAGPGPAGDRRRRQAGEVGEAAPGPGRPGRARELHP